MPNSLKYLERLVRNLFDSLEPSPLFIESLSKYLKPQNTSAPNIDMLLNSKSEKAHFLFKKLPQNDNLTKIIYIFLCLSDKKPSINDDLKTYLKQGALGFETSYFNPTAMASLRSKINISIFNITYIVYSSGLIYKQLIIEQEKPYSLAHKYFLKKINPFLREYEKTVIESVNDFLSFYSSMYINFKNIKKLGMLNEAFKNKANLTAFTKLSLNFDNATLSVIDPLFEGFEDVIYQVYNEFTISYLLTGSFEDPFSEFFVKNHVLDYGLIPSFISKHTAETIKYIGKCSAFLKSINLLEIPYEVQKSIKNINLIENSAINYLKQALISINTQLYNNFFVNYKIFDLLKFIHSTFLFGRSDFIEKLFISLKESRKTGRKNISNILENSLNSSFPGSPFNSLVDIYITPEDSEDERSKTADSFSLYIKLDYPISFLIEEECIIKLVYIFKFLWKLKKIDHLSRKLHDLKYYNFIQKFQFYVFNEVIGGFYFEIPENDTFCFEILKSNINKKLDEIMKKLFINTRTKTTEFMLFYIEKYLVGKGTNNITVQETDVQQAFNDFYESSKDNLIGTYLFNIQEIFH